MTMPRRAVLIGILSVPGLSACGGDEHANGPAGKSDGGGGTAGTLAAGGTSAASGGTSAASGGASGTSGGAGTASGGRSAAGSGGLPGTGSGGAAPGTGGRAVAGDSGTVTADAGLGSRNGTIVPLYSYPTDAPWSAIAAASRAHPTVRVVAIIDPSDTGAGPSRDQAYVDGITRLKGANIVVIGYVSTRYAKRPAAEVDTEIDHYRTWYPATDGIFLDEMDDAGGTEGYYSSASAYARSQGFSFVVGNPGTETPPSYVGTVDTMTIYESAGVPGTASLRWTGAFGRENFAVIPYAVPSLDVAFVGEAVKSVRYVYMTNDDLDNPWDTLPPYFDALLAALE